MSEEEKRAIEDFKKDLERVNNKLILCKQGLLDLKTLLNLIEKLQKENELAKQTLIENCNIVDERNQLLKENEEYKKFLEKTIKEYIPDYELEELVNRYKNESFIPRVEVKKILEDRRNMYDEEAMISIISDNFNLSRNEVLELLGGN